MAVATGGLRAGFLDVGRADLMEVAMATRNRLREQQDLVSSDVQFAYPQNFGDTLKVMRDELTDGALLLRTKKWDPATDEFDPRNPTYVLTDQVGVPVSGYTIEPDTGWIRCDTVVSGTGVWHPRNLADRDYYFGRRFTLDSVPGSADFDLTTSDGFSMYINNQLVYSSTVGGTFNNIDIQPYLQAGENQIVVQTRRASATAGSVRVFGDTLAGVDLSTAGGLWSASIHSVLGIAGRVDFKSYEGGALAKRGDQFQRAAVALDTLTSLLRAEAQYFDGLLATVR